MAEFLLRRRLEQAGIDARVHSAGLMSDGQPAPPDGIEVMAALGIDTSPHLSRRMTVEMLERADLVIGMAKEHVREAVLLHPPAWPRTFTLKELVRRGEDAGPRSAGQAIGEWIEKVHAGRSRADMLGSSTTDDVADPIGRKRTVYEATAAELDELTGTLAVLMGA
jgi:protein-tyrosine phosphatase